MKGKNRGFGTGRGGPLRRRYRGVYGDLWRKISIHYRCTDYSIESIRGVLIKPESGNPKKETFRAF